MKDDDKNRWKMTIETNEDNNIINKKMIIETEWKIVIGNRQKNEKWMKKRWLRMRIKNKEKQKMNKKRNNKEQKMTRSKTHKKNEVSEKRNNVINKQGKKNKKIKTYTP